jgi:hypothetical protein
MMSTATRASENHPSDRFDVRRRVPRRPTATDLQRGKVDFEKKGFRSTSPAKSNSTSAAAAFAASLWVAPKVDAWMDCVDTGKPVSVPSAKQPSAACSTCSANRSINAAQSSATNTGRFTAKLLPRRTVDQHRSLRNRYQGYRLADSVRPRW